MRPAARSFAIRLSAVPFHQAQRKDFVRDARRRSATFPEAAQFVSTSIRKDYLRFFTPVVSLPSPIFLLSRSQHDAGLRIMT